MKTIVAITTQNKKTISEHAGKCRNFLIYTIIDTTIENKKLLELTEEETLHNFLHNQNQTTHDLLDVDILLTRGIGEGAIQKLANHNVACYRIEEKDPDNAINMLIKGTLEAYVPVSADKSGCNCNCGENHNHHHGHSHHHN